MEVRAWQLVCSVTNSFRYAGHESPKRHETDKEVVGMESVPKHSYELQDGLGSSGPHAMHPAPCVWVAAQPPLSLEGKMQALSCGEVNTSTQLDSRLPAACLCCPDTAKGPISRAGQQVHAGADRASHGTNG